MIHKHIKTLPHHPKRVVIVSLITAVAIGTWGYFEIHKDIAIPNIKESVSTSSTTSPQNLTLGFLASGRIKSVFVKAGDIVTKGQVLAELDAENTVGALTQAQAAYAAAQANYQKVINGATGSTIDISKSALNTAKINLEQTKNQQNIAVANARRKLYSDNLVAISANNTRLNIAPLITGSYNGEQEGQYKIFFADANALNGLRDTSFIGLEKGTVKKDTSPQPMGTLGLYVTFPQADYLSDDRWTVDIPNKNGANYVSNLNAYQLALQNRDQLVASAQAAFDQANANLISVVTTARPEDIAAASAQKESAFGAVQIAQAAYNNTVITAPSDGTVTSVSISAGQIAIPNSPAIGFTSNISN